MKTNNIFKKNFEKMKITTDDIKRNIEKIKNNEQLDIPLHLIPTNQREKMKRASYNYDHTKKNKRKWRLKNKSRINAAATINYYKNDESKLNKKLEFCFWYIYYYSKLKRYKSESNS